MQVKNRLFPYPVINNNKIFSNYLCNDFKLEYELEIDEYKVILKNARFKTDSNYINMLYDEGKLRISCVIECSNTVYRKSVDLDKLGKDITLFNSDFDERVDISMFATALMDFNLSSEEFDEDYSSIVFEIEKYDILGAYDGINIYFRHEEKEESLTQSIFTVITSTDHIPGSYTVECDTSKKIVVTMSEVDYQNYKLIHAVPLYTEVFFNMLLIPALIEGLTLCKKILQDDLSKDLDDVGNQYPWFRSIQNAYKRLTGMELVQDEFLNISVSSFAQNLMGKPFGISLEKLVDEIKHIERGNDGE